MTAEQERQACLKKALARVAELAYWKGRLSIRLKRAEAEIVAWRAKGYDDLLDACQAVVADIFYDNIEGERLVLPLTALKLRAAIAKACKDKP